MKCLDTKLLYKKYPILRNYLKFKIKESFCYNPWDNPWFKLKNNIYIKYSFFNKER